MLSRASVVSALAVALLLGASADVEANPAQLFGNGAAAQGRGGGGITFDGDAYSSWLNPAALAWMNQGELAIGVQFGGIELAPLPGVETFNLDGSLRGEAPSDPFPPNGVSVGLTVPITRRFHVAASVYYPFSGFISMKNWDPLVPESLRWRNRPVEGHVELAAALRPAPGLRLGFGLGLVPRGIIQIELAMSGEEPPEGGDPVGYVNVTDALLRGVLVPQPIAGLGLDFGEWTDALRGLRFGFTFRSARSVSLIDTQLDVRVDGLGELLGLPGLVNHVSASVVLLLTDFYDPLTLTWGIGYHRPRFSASVDVALRAWGGYEGTIARLVEQQAADANQLEVGLAAETLSYALRDARTHGGYFRDVPRIDVGLEITSPPSERFLGFSFEAVPRFGYSFEPSYLNPALRGDTGLLIGDHHRFSAGLGIHAHTRLGRPIRHIELNFAFQLHRETGVTVTAPEPHPAAARVSWETDSADWTGAWAGIGHVDLRFGF